MIWHWQKRIKELEERVHQLKSAGWYSVNGWEWTINNKDKTFSDNPYSWYRAREIFSTDKSIDNKVKDIIDDNYWNGKFE